MNARLHVLVDASAGMASMGKLRCCLAAVSSLVRSSLLYSQIPKLSVWRFGNEIEISTRPDITPGREASIPALTQWLKKQAEDTAEDETLMVILMSDGLFEDFSGMKELEDWIRSQARLRLVPVAAGPDRDMRSLARLAVGTHVWKLNELHLALRELLGRPQEKENIESLMASFLDDGEND